MSNTYLIHNIKNGCITIIEKYNYNFDYINLPTVLNTLINEYTNHTILIHTRTRNNKTNESFMSDYYATVSYFTINNQFINNENITCEFSLDINHFYSNVIFAIHNLNVRQKLNYQHNIELFNAITKYYSRNIFIDIAPKIYVRDQILYDNMITLINSFINYHLINVFNKKITIRC